MIQRAAPMSEPRAEGGGKIETSTLAGRPAELYLLVIQVPRVRTAHRIRRTLEHVSMNPEANPTRWIRPWGATLVALAALVALAPTSALAGCLGHAVSGSRPAPASRLEGLAEIDALGTPAPDLPHEPDDAPAPCTGAFCSGSPATPSPTTSAPIPPPGLWAILPEGPAPEVQGSLPYPFDDPSRLPSSRDLSVFHPPRSLASACR